MKFHIETPKYKVFNAWQSACLYMDASLYVFMSTHRCLSGHIDIHFSKQF